MKRILAAMLGLVGKGLVVVGNGLRRTSLHMAVANRAAGPLPTETQYLTTKSRSDWMATYRTSIPPGGVMARVGSRATCSPPPTDTDEDFAVLVPNMNEAVKHLIEMGFETETDPEKFAEYARMGREIGSCFSSLRFGDVNYIVTDNIFFFERFLTGAYICRMLNLMDKEQRIIVHAAIRGATYARQYCPEFRPNMDKMYTQRKRLESGELSTEYYDAQLDASMVDTVVNTVQVEAFRNGNQVPF